MDLWEEEEKVEREEEGEKGSTLTVFELHGIKTILVFWF